MKLAGTHIHPFNQGETPRGEQAQPTHLNKPVAKACRLPVKRFDHRLGLTSLQIHITLCSQDGRIWSATPAGLACYDGVTMRMYGRKQGLRSHGLRTIALGQENQLWLGTDIGVEVLDISEDEPQTLWYDDIGTVNDIDIASTSGVIGTSAGLFAWAGGSKLSRARNKELSSATIKSVRMDHRNYAWIVGPLIGLVVLDTNYKVSTAPETEELIGVARVLAQRDDQGIVIGGERGIICVKNDGALSAALHTDQPVTALTCYLDEVWAGVGRRLQRFDLASTQPQLAETVHEDLVTHHIMMDRFDNVWISSGDQSLLRISTMRNTFEDSLDVDVGPVMCIEQAENGLLIGGAAGLSRKGWGRTLDGIEVWDTLMDGSGKIWSATNFGLYCQVNPHITIPYRHDDCDVVAAPCRALMIFWGRLYVSSIRGLACVDSNGIKEVLDEADQSLGYVYSLHVGPQGRLWIATLGRGIFLLTEKGAVKFDVKTMGKNSNVYAFAHVANGDIFVAHDNLISKVSPEGMAHQFVETDAPISAWTLQVLGNRYLAAGASNGLILYDLANGSVHRKISGNFDDVPWEFTTSRSLKLLDNQTLYCGLGSGLRKVNLEGLVQGELKPAAKLRGAKWRGVVPETVNNLVTVQAGNWYLEVGLQTCWYLDDCTMRFRLNGFNDEWSPESAVGSLKFTSLPPGDYTLDVELNSPLAGTGPVSRVFEFRVI